MKVVIWLWWVKRRVKTIFFLKKASEWTPNAHAQNNSAQLAQNDEHASVS
jgi:hypothetical protein